MTLDFLRNLSFAPEKPAQKGRVGGVEKRKGEGRRREKRREGREKGRAEEGRRDDRKVEERREERGEEKRGWWAAGKEERRERT